MAIERKIQSVSDSPETQDKETFSDKFPIDRITSESKLPDLEPVIMIDEANFAIRGDISFISGQPKSGKSTVCGIILATALMKFVPPSLDTLKISSKFCDNREVIYVDTEQPKVFSKKILDTIKLILNVHREPENLHIYNLRNYTKSKKAEYVEALFKEFPKAHLWIIDGVADLIKNNNDPVEAEEKINWFMAQASIYNTTIVLILHENSFSQKMRGHTGSEAERKCGGSIAIRKDKKGIHSIESKMIRGSKDFDTIFFSYDNDLKRMASLGADITKKLVEDSKPENLKFKKYSDLCNNLFVGGTEHIDDKELINRITIHGHVGRTTAFTYKRNMKELNIILLDEAGKYYWNKEGLPEGLESIKQKEIPFKASEQE